MTSPQPPSGPIGRLLTPLLDRVTSLQRRVNESPTFHWATVTSASPLRVRIDGSTAPLDATPDLAVPAPGEGARVLVMFQNGRWAVVAGGDLANTVEIKIGSVLLTDSFENFSYLDGYVFARQPNVTLQLLSTAGAATGMTSMVANRTVSGFRARKVGGAQDSATFMYIAASATD